MYLPGINYVAWLRCSSLPAGVARRAASGLPVSVTADSIRIPLCREAECKAETETVNHASFETTTLTFLTSEELPAFTDMAFVIRDAAGSAFLIGAYEHPHPLVRKVWSSGSNNGEPACWTVEVTLTARRSLIKCIF